MRTLSAPERSHVEPQHRGPKHWGMGDYVFATFILLVVVGLQPFAPAPPVRSLADAADGDVARQISFLLMFGVIVLTSVRSGGIRALWTLPPLLTAALLWLMMSSLWSIAPDVTFRRAALTIIATLSTFLIVKAIGIERAFRVIYLLFGALLLVNLVSVFVVPQAVHGASDGAALAGNWRGFHSHKNAAGAFAAVSALLFLSRSFSEKKLRDALLFFGALVFTVQSQSKTALVLLMVCCIVMAFTWWATKAPSRKTTFVGVTFFLLALGVSLAVPLMGSIVDLLADPAALTGRGAIWNLTLSYALEHPWLGSGYGAFWQSGLASPILYVADEQMLSLNQSHNGYLEMFATVGVPGLTLAVLSAFILPFVRVITLTTYTPYLLLPWLTFFVLQNVTETMMFRGTATFWVLHLIVLASLSRRSDGNPRTDCNEVPTSQRHRQVTANIYRECLAHPVRREC